MSATGQYTNGHEEPTGPRDELDMQHSIIRSSDGNPLLEMTNLGTGRYTEKYLWQQVRSYRKGLYAYVAFGNVLSKRAVYQTKLALGRDGYVHYDEEGMEVKDWPPLTESDDAEVQDGESTWTAQLRRGEEIWESLGEAPLPVTDKQVAAVLKKTNVEPGKWLPMYWQMVAGRHDVSKSLEAELLRDIFSDMKHLRDDTKETGRLADLIGGER